MIRKDLSLPPFSTIPENNPHAVGVHFASLDDVRGYEEWNIEVLLKMYWKWYHRFSENIFNKKLKESLMEKYSINGDISVLNSGNALRLFREHFNDKLFSVIEEKDISIIYNTSHFKEEIKKFLQHTGMGVSSRASESYMIGENNRVFPKQEKYIKNVLWDIYWAPAEDVFLASNGMSAIYSIFNSLNQIDEWGNSKSWCQFGWLYLDTGEILSKYSKKSVFISDINNFKELEDNFASGSIKTVITEVPTNPLIQVPDLERLSKLCKKYGVVLVLDTSLWTWVNLDVLPYADVVVESLTKFASWSGDLMAWAIVLNQNSSFYSVLKDRVGSNIISPDGSTVKRLSSQIGGYKNRMRKISQNTLRLVEKLEKLEWISKIHYPHSSDSKENYTKIERYPWAVWWVISIEFEWNFEKIYNSLLLPKWPSFWMEKTMAMPYVYLAHYDLIQTKEGRDHLKKNGINQDLLRLSVGLEDPDIIYEIIKEAVKGGR